jgi:hypothetical protein
VTELDVRGGGAEPVEHVAEPVDAPRLLADDQDAHAVVVELAALHPLPQPGLEPLLDGSPSMRATATRAMTATGSSASRACSMTWARRCSTDHQAPQLLQRR